MHKKYAIALLLATSLLLSLFTAEATDALSGWKAGRIINDSVFTDYKSMSASQIQSFLNKRVPVCDTNGQQLSENGGPDLNKDGKVQRWEWGKSKYGETTFICLKDYSVGGKKASQIIYEKALKYRISPKVLLVLLQKEQGLVTDTWPVSIQYRSATGYGCPDTAPCASQYYGLANQLDWAAKMFRAIMDNSPDWYTPYETGQNYVRYNPSSSCGGSSVNIENRATQALYNYTPYQPNKAALDAGWGSAPPCGAYGNRNFFLYFSSWFGRPNGNPFVGLDEPRWMQTKITVSKYDLITGNAVDAPLSSGSQYRFIDKISIDGIIYLRTEYDKSYGYMKGIKLTDLTEIPYLPLNEPRKMQVTTTTNKVLPRTGGITTNEVINGGTTPKFTSKITVNGILYYRTAYDENNTYSKGILAVKTAPITFVPLREPRYLEINQDIMKVDPVTDTASSMNILKGTQVRFTAKIYVDGQWFYQTESDATLGEVWVIPAKATIEVPYLPITPRAMKLTSTLPKTIPATGVDVDEALPLGTRLWFTSVLHLNGETYYRTKSDSTNNYNKALPSTVLEQIYVTYSPISPVTLQTTQALRKLSSYTLTASNDRLVLPKGKSLTFTSSLTVDGKVYYRTQSDTRYNRHKVIPLNSLK